MSDTTPNSGHIWCSALFAQFSANGVEHAVISPGSRSTPLAVAADQTNSLKTSIHLDERSGSYFALGLAKSTRKPVILICTSGTAAANYLPAVIEAFHAGVPLIVLSADRPPELQERGAPQTIDQTNLYGSHVRAFHQAPVASTSTAGEAIALGATAYFQSLNPITGPVHINCPMREPLEPTGQLPSFFDLIDQTESIQKIELEPIKDLLNHEKGLIIAGPMHYDNKELMQIAKLGASTGWPIIADPASGLRNGTHVKNALVMASGEHILRSLWAIRHRPDVIFQLGKMPTSKGYKIFLNRTGCNNLVSIDDLGFFPDPENLVTHRVNLAPGLLASH